MAITIAQQPENIAFSGNPIVFKLQSDAANGTAFLGSIDRMKLVEVGKKILIQFGDQSVEMTQANIPDDSGKQFNPFGKNGNFYTAGELASFFKANYLLNKYYIIEAKDQDRILFRARGIGTFYNWKSSPDLTIEKPGVDRKENLKFLLEVFFRNSSGSDFECVYTEELNQDSSFLGNLSIDVASILDACLKDEIPVDTAVPRLCNASKGEYYCRFSELSGTPPKPGKGFQSDIKHVVKGGLSYVGFKTQQLQNLFQPDPNDASKDTFLKQGPRSITVRNGQPENLYFINSRANTNQLRLKTSIVYVDGSTSDVLSDPIKAKLYDKLTFPLTFLPSKSGKNIQGYRCCLLDQADHAASETINYQLDNQVRDQLRYFRYISSLGSLETLVAYGRGMQEYEINGQVAGKPQKLDYALYEGNRTNFDLKIQRTFTVTTGWLDRRSFDLLADFFLSEKKWMLKNGVHLPITVTNKKAGEYHDLNPLIAQTFEYRLNFEDDYFTEGDI